MTVFNDIQADILSSAPISTVLRKAKVLAYQLDNQELKNWVGHELDGYKHGSDILPKYRKFRGLAFGTFADGFRTISPFAIPISVLPDALQHITDVDITYGVKQIEALIEPDSANKGDTSIRAPWPAEVLPFLSDTILKGMTCLEAYTVIPKDKFSQILDATRNNLLTFILELASRYPQARVSGTNLAQVIPDKQLGQLVQVYIYGGNPSILGSGTSLSHGGSMAIFDQRHQIVQYQYNAAGDINLDSVQGRADFIAQLDRLKAELAKAAAADVIDDELVTDAEYEITKAIQQSRKSEPDKNSISTHLNRAKTYIEGVAAVSGLVTSLTKAGELVQTLF